MRRREIPLASASGDVQAPVMRIDDTRIAIRILRLTVATGLMSRATVRTGRLDALGTLTASLDVLG